MDKKVPADEYIIYINLNKPVYFFGLSGIQILITLVTGVITGLVCFFIGGFIIGMFIFMPLVMVLYYLIGVIRKKNRMGYPNYIRSFMIKEKNPYTVRDNGTLKKIYGKKV